MRKDLWLAATVAILLFPAIALCQQQDAQQQQSPAPQAQSQTNPQAPPAQPLEEAPLAAAARRAREQKKDSSKPAKVFDNDNIPTTGGVSTVGSSSSTSGSGSATSDSTAPSAGGAASSGKGEKQWRQKFADLRHKLEADQASLEVMQRELGQLNIQYYSDPVKGMQQGLTRSDINDATAKIDALQKQIQADQQAISDAEDELRKAGGDSGWAR
ncbi:MAG: hypothetical protein WB780_14765 [Candidatus Acidiferrales bacterium]